MLAWDRVGPCNSRDRLSGPLRRTNDVCNVFRKNETASLSGDLYAWGGGGGGGVAGAYVTNIWDLCIGLPLRV